jgi:hypothetical protein
LAAVNPARADETDRPVEEDSLEGAREAVKLDVPNLPRRFVREHLDPVLRNRLRA